MDDKKKYLILDIANLRLEKDEQGNLASWVEVKAHGKNVREAMRDFTLPELARRGEVYKKISLELVEEE